MELYTIHYSSIVLLLESITTAQSKILVLEDIFENIIILNLKTQKHQDKLCKFSFYFL